MILTTKYKLFKFALGFILGLSMLLVFPLTNHSQEQNPQAVPPAPIEVDKEELQPDNVPAFHAPVCLLVGLNSKELSYSEISVLSGFELFSVPYRTDIQAVVEQIKPSQVIVRHPSGFVGLYTTDGELIRGIKTLRDYDVQTGYNATPPSILKPTEAHPMYENLYYPGALSGAIPHGGIGHASHPKGRGVGRHILKLTALLGLTPFQYPGYFMAYQTYDTEKLFPALVLPQVPTAIGAAATIIDSRYDQAEYGEVRSQPRDYMFQPIVEGY